MSSFSVSVIAGGLYHCDPRWTRAERYRAAFHRIYVPMSGRARYAIGDTWTDVRPGRLYVIPAHAENRQECNGRMDVHWLHFTADAVPMAQRLARVRSLESWPEAEWRWWRPTYRRIAEHISGGGTPLAAAVHSFALAVAAAVIARVPADESLTADERSRFAPALTLAERRFPQAVPIPELARAVGMSAVHFRRSFTRAFGIPPHAFLAQRRMDRAAGMLVDSEIAISAISQACGYDDPFYFSRAFKRHHHVSPAGFRSARSRLP
ncbi:MAG: helix-turn-helix transcriptional regulator [Planctomycetes bacterium]|nr:helix-turn-helix transcriptional regulator [Planctomycetota bacterium]